MSPIIHCIRHGQSLHNVSTSNHTIRDPNLTQQGVLSCTELAKHFGSRSDIGLVVVSPLRRAIYTAFYTFDGPRLRNGSLKMIVVPSIQETSAAICDQGLPLSQLKAELTANDVPIDLSLLDEDWNVKTGVNAAEVSSVRARARRVRQWLKGRPESEIAVVTHRGFLHYFVAKRETSPTHRKTSWPNADFGSYHFVESALDLGDDEAALVETDESRRRRSI